MDKRKNNHRLTSKQTLKYVCNSGSQLTSVKEDGLIIASYTFNKNSMPTSTTLGNGITAKYQYNLANLMRNISYDLGTANLFKESYSYSLERNMTGKNGAVYAYDAQDRLKNETNKNYTFNNNLLARTGYKDSLGKVVIEQKAGLKGQTVETATSSYVYDNNGNRTAKSQYTNGQFFYYFDPFNRFTKCKTFSNAMTAEFTYRPDNLRLKITKGTFINYLIWDGGQIVAELNGTGVLTDCYAYGLERIKSKGIRYFIQNGQGDVVHYADKNGKIMTSYSYDEYGNVTGGNATNPFRYRGEYYDTDLRL